MGLGLQVPNILLDVGQDHLALAEAYRNDHGVFAGNGVVDDGLAAEVLTEHVDAEGEEELEEGNVLLLDGQVDQGALDLVTLRGRAGIAGGGPA